MTLLRADELTVRFDKGDKSVYAVNGVSFKIEAGDVVALVGESGSGKSVTALTIMGLHNKAEARVGGKLEWRRAQLPPPGDPAWRRHRGKDFAMVFQDPGEALNPSMRVVNQVAEAIRAHNDIGRAEARAQAQSGLDAVGLDKDQWKKYPHELSGGQQQRVVIAMAVACKPALLIADEPTTALDVTTQAEIVELIRTVGRDMAILWITHDLALAATLVDRVLVMYAGRVVEEAPVDRLFAAPAHPYTKALLAALPSLTSIRGTPLTPIEGSPPELTAEPMGCAFSARCSYRIDVCASEVPEVERRAAGHYVSCHRADAVEADR